MEGPMPGAPLGNKPRAFRFKPGIRLDCSWREMGTDPLMQHTSRFVCLLIGTSLTDKSRLQIRVKKININLRGTSASMFINPDFRLSTQALEALFVPHC